MENRPVQIQSVIRKEKKELLLKAIESAANSVKISERGEAVFAFGDISETPVFESGEVAALNEKYCGKLSVGYDFFGAELSFPEAHNRLSKKANTGYLVFLAADGVVAPRTLDVLVSAFKKEDCGISEARQTPYEHPKEYNKNTFETAFSTADCTCVKAETFRSLRGFDVLFENALYDVDFSYRVRLAGKKIYYRPDAAVFRTAVSGNNAGKRVNADFEKLLMAYKWSDEDGFRRLSKNADALCRFEALKKCGALPEILDKNHKIARFIGDNYAEYRYAL